MPAFFSFLLGSAFPPPPTRSPALKDPAFFLHSHEFTYITRRTDGGGGDSERGQRRGERREEGEVEEELEEEEEERRRLE